MPIRFHLDENVATEIALGLRTMGVDVTVPAEAGLVGAMDEDHLAYCRRNSRMLLTHDDDYLRLHRSGIEHYGIAYCRARKRTSRQIIGTLTLLWEAYQAEEMRNRIEFL